MSHHIHATHHFTNVNVIDIKQAPLYRLDSLLRQVILDADYDQLTKLDSHTSARDVATIAEYWSLFDPLQGEKLRHVAIIASHIESRLSRDA